MVAPSRVGHVPVSVDLRVERWVIISMMVTCYANALIEED